MVNTNCQEITTKINSIKSKKLDFDNLQNTDIPKAFALIKEIQISIQEIKEQLVPFILIEGKKFPIHSLTIGGKTEEELYDLFDKTNENDEYIINIFSGDSNFRPRKNDPDIFKLRFKDAFRNVFNNDHVKQRQVDSETIQTVILKFSDLGFDFKVSLEQIQARAKKLGLGLFCPPETAIYQRLNDKNQPLDDVYSVVTNTIVFGSNRFELFRISNFPAGLEISNHSYSPDDNIQREQKIMFRVL